VADALSQLNPSASDEWLFQEARRIVIAEMQHITYNEFLPIIFDDVPNLQTPAPVASSTKTTKKAETG